MNRLDQLLNTSNFEQAKKYALEIARNKNSLLLLIQCLSSEETREEIREAIAEALGQIGDYAILPLIRLYHESEEHSSARFYAAYALSEYTLSEGAHVNDEIRCLLLDGIQCNNQEIRRIIASADIPHHIENIYPWLKYISIEYKGSDFFEQATYHVDNYFKNVSKKEIRKLEELSLEANEEENIALSLAIISIRSENMSTLIRQLLLKVKEQNIKKLLIHSLNWEAHLDSANITFLENLKTQETQEIQAVIEDTLKSLKAKIKGSE